MSSATTARRYFLREKLVLKLLGVSLSGNESLTYKIYSFIVFGIFNVAYPIAAAGDLFKHEFSVVTELYVYVVGSAMGVLITSVVYRNRIQLGKLIHKLEKEPFIANIERGGDVEESLINGWFSFSTIQSLVFIVGVTISLGSQTVYTLIQRLKSDDYHDWKFSFGPITIVNVTYSPNYEILWLYQNICLLCIGYNMSSSTLILAGILAYVSVQFQMLQNNVRRLATNSYQKMLKDGITTCDKCLSDVSLIPWEYLKESLKQVIGYHLSILEVVNEFEKIFSMLILWIYLGTLSILCFEVYRATLIPMDDPRMIRLLIEYASVSFQVFIICFCGERVTQESEAVAKAAYETAFVGADQRFQKGLIIIVRRSQDSTKIKAGKFAETSMITFGWILRTSYSAFMMLRNANMRNLDTS